MGLFGTGTKTIDAVGNAIDKVFTSDDERLSKAEVMAKMQSDITIAELQTRSIFLAAGGRFWAGCWQYQSLSALSFSLWLNGYSAVFFIIRYHPLIRAWTGL
jgi:hypothetical protein